MPSLNEPDIDEVIVTQISGQELRVTPLEIYFDAPASKSSGEWMLKAFDPEHDRDLVIPMHNVTRWRPA